MPLAQPPLDADVIDRLRPVLVAAGHITGQCGLEPLSGGRTNRLWRAQGNTGTVVIKLFAGRSDNPLFVNDADAEIAMLRHLAGTGLAPRLRAVLDSRMGKIVIYDHVEGDPWTGDPAPVAETLSRLHRQPVLATLDHAVDGSVALSRQTLEILDKCPDSPARELRALEPEGAIAPTCKKVPLHGDVVPGNIIGSRGGITLIDWQCPAQGDPLHDLAMFLSPAMQLVYRGQPLSACEEARFLSAYGCNATRDRYLALAPWLHWRMTAYCLWRVSRGASDYIPAMALEKRKLTG